MAEPDQDILTFGHSLGSFVVYGLVQLQDAASFCCFYIVVPRTPPAEFLPEPRTGKLFFCIARARETVVSHGSDENEDDGSKSFSTKKI